MWSVGRGGLRTDSNLRSIELVFADDLDYMRVEEINLTKLARKTCKATYPLLSRQ